MDGVGGEKQVQQSSGSQGLSAKSKGFNDVPADVQKVIMNNLTPSDRAQASLAGKKVAAIRRVMLSSKLQDAVSKIQTVGVALHLEGHLDDQQLAQIMSIDASTKLTPRTVNDDLQGTGQIMLGRLAALSPCVEIYQSNDPHVPSEEQFGDFADQPYEALNPHQQLQKFLFSQFSREDLSDQAEARHRELNGEELGPFLYSMEEASYIIRNAEPDQLVAMAHDMLTVRLAESLADQNDGDEEWAKDVISGLGVDEFQDLFREHFGPDDADGGE